MTLLISGLLVMAALVSLIALASGVSARRRFERQLRELPRGDSDIKAVIRAGMVRRMR